MDQSSHVAIWTACMSLETSIIGIASRLSQQHFGILVPCDCHSLQIHYICASLGAHHFYELG